MIAKSKSCYPKKISLYLIRLLISNTKEQNESINADRIIDIDLLVIS